MIKTDFIKMYENLNTLNETFIYKEEDILSDEEVKEITDKIAELKPEEDKARAACQAIRDRLKADNVPINKWSEDPEYQEASVIYQSVRNQVWPLKSKLNKHNEVLRYISADGQVATEEDWDRILGYEWDVEVEDLEVEVYRKESEYESGWDSMRDSIIYTTIPAQSGYIKRWTVTVEVTKEHVADFLDKEVDEVTTKDIMDLDEKEFTEYLSNCEDVVDQAIKEAEDAVESGDYDYDDVSWKDKDWDW